MAINLKGFRNIVVDGIKYKYKCVSYEKTIVADKDGNFLMELYANNSGEIDLMSLPSIVADKIKRRLNENTEKDI